ncbi:MAG: CCA tRNA nucleotidyltransferase [Chloroflexi bacterium]|nr:CCA tRNA nucleotidyltransferase [Chloroflexota bacterium]
MSNGLLQRIPNLEGIARLLDRLGITAFAVGGYVRDTLLGRSTDDIDIAVYGDSLQIGKRVADELDGRYVVLDETNRVARVAFLSDMQRLCVDFSGFERDIESDLSRRDFTVNAMAVDVRYVQSAPESWSIIDPFHGREDLIEKRLRAVSDGIFCSDPARLLRAIRLCGQLGLIVERQTEQIVRRDASLLASVAGERVHEDLERILSLPHTAELFDYMDRLGLLLVVFPELAPARGLEQPKEHYWDVLEHCKKTVAAAEFLMHQGEWPYNGNEVLSAVPWSAALAKHFAAPVTKGSSRGMVLKLACLLHDVAKPGTKSIDASGRYRFLGHAKIGASVARSALERLRFSAREASLVEVEVDYHLRPGQLSQGQGTMPTRRAIYRYFRDTGDAGIDVFFLSLADYLAARGPLLDIEDWRGHTELMAYVLIEHERQETVIASPKIIDGYDIMKTFGVQPGPELGAVLQQVREAQAAGEISTREEAIECTRGLLASIKERERTK